jgi:hypothetical protein
LFFPLDVSRLLTRRQRRADVKTGKFAATRGIGTLDGAVQSVRLNAHRPHNRKKLLNLPGFGWPVRAHYLAV